MEILSK
jgi:hypothetical protein